MGNWVASLGLSEVFEGLLCCSSSFVSVLCSSCSTGYPRLFFGLFFLFGSILNFIVLTPNMRTMLGKLPYFCTAVTTEEMCDNLVGYGAVYRICLSLAIFYATFAVLMFNTSSTKDIRLKFHNGYWILKLVFLALILVGAFHIPRHTDFDRMWMYVGLTAGFIFIMIQILLVIDFAHSWCVSWEERVESGNGHFWSCALAFSTILLYSLAITMAVFYYLYFTKLRDFTKCRGNMFLISFNVLHCLLASIISILPRVQDSVPGSGLLQSSIVSLYAMYLTWCALSSEPDGSCNPMGDVILEYDKVARVNSQALFDCILMFAVLIFACNVPSSTSRLEKIGLSLSKYTITEIDYSDVEESTLNFRDKKDDAEKYGDTKGAGDEFVRYNYSLFHAVMFLASLQLMMVVTNWHSPDERADMKRLVKNWATVWIQLSSSFLCVLFYIWANVTPLFVRTWGPCLGLDYESVPTEDVKERARQRKDISSQNEVIQRSLQQHRKENDLRKTRNEHFENKGSLASSINFKVENTMTESTKKGRQNIGEKLLSLIKLYTSGKKNEEVTQDSGMCDTNFTISHSRPVSRENARPSSPKPELSHVHSENEIGEDNKLRNLEKRLPNLKTRETIQEARENTKIADVERESDLKRTEISRLGSVQLSLAELSKFNLSRNKRKDGSTRPQSSIAIRREKISTEDETLIHLGKINSRPHTCEPWLSLHEVSRETRSQESTRGEQNRVDSFTGRETGKNDAEEIHKENEIIPTLQESLFDQHEVNTKINPSEIGTNTETSTEPGCQNLEHTPDEPNRTSNCTQNNATLDNSPHQVSANFLERQTSATTPGRETPKPDPHSTQADEKNSTTREESAGATLKRQDSLNWVKSLRKSRKKPLHQSRHEFSGQEFREEQARRRPKERKGRSQGTNAKKENDTSENEENAERESQCGSTLSKRSENEVSEAIQQNRSHGGGEQRNSLCEKELVRGKDITGRKSDKNAGRDQRTSPAKTVTSVGRTELQTPDVSKEILRLQEKILKFQAKVVKTQQKIYEMQQDNG